MTLAEFLRQFTDQNKQDWDRFLEMATFSYNTSFHEATKATPYELVFGRLAEFPASSVAPASKLETIDSYLVTLVKRINELNQTARENLIKSKERYKQIYDRNCVPKIFHIGDNILLIPGPHPKKLQDRYLGPYAVADTFDNYNIRIKIGPTKYKIVHSNRVKLAYGVRPKFPLL